MRTSQTKRPATERHFLIRKPRRRTPIIPPLPEDELAWLAGELGPGERQAMRHIAANADILTVDDQLWLLVPVGQHPELLDVLAAFEADGEDRENDLEDEPDEGREDDTACDGEDDLLPARARFAQQRRRPRRTYTQKEGYRLIHQTNHDAAKDRRERQRVTRCLRGGVS